jgi:nitric oxide reductase NorE protein
VTLEGQAAEANVPDFLWPDVEHAPPPGLPRRERTNGNWSGHVPGEVGLWIFILGDMTLFGAIFIVMMWENRSARAVFHGSALELSRSIGVVNTLVLLLSSYLVVAAVWAHRRDDHARSSRMVFAAIGCALVFAALKAVEYSFGIGGGHTPTTNLFFTFYFVLTGVHLLHVVVGTGLLAAWSVAMRRRTPWNASRQLFEGVAVYWHMVDLLWIAIFTLVYLVCAT